MKLLIITAAKAFEESIKKLLADNHVITYSYTAVIGYRDSTLDAVDSNWFGTEMNQTPSLLFFAFVREVSAESVFRAVEQLNEDTGLHSKVHLAVTSIEKSS